MCVGWVDLYLFCAEAKVMPFSACHQQGLWRQLSAQSLLSASLNFIIKCPLSLGRVKMPHQPKYISHLGILPGFVLLCCRSECAFWMDPVNHSHSVCGLGNKPKSGLMLTFCWLLKGGRWISVLCNLQWVLNNNQSLGSFNQASNSKSRSYDGTYKVSHLKQFTIVTRKQSSANHFYAEAANPMKTHHWNDVISHPYGFICGFSL